MTSKSFAWSQHWISLRETIHWAESTDCLVHGVRIWARCVSQAQERISLWEEAGSGRVLGFSPVLQRKAKSTNPLPSMARTECAPCSWHLWPSQASMQPSPGLCCPLPRLRYRETSTLEVTRGWSSFLQLPSFLPLYFLLLPLCTLLV